MIRYVSISYFIILMFCCSSKETDKIVDLPSSKRSSTLLDNEINKNEICDCINDYESKIKFTDSNNNSISICGTIETIKENSYIVSEFIMIDCYNGDTIRDNSSDATTSIQIDIYKDSMVISSMQLMLFVSEMELKQVKLYSNKYFFNNRNQLIIGDLIYILEPQVLSESELKMIDSLCANIELEINNPKTMYPFDEESIYMLLTGAINGHKKSNYLLKNLNNLFDLDGAIAETFAEIPYEFIMKKGHLSIGSY